MEVNLKDLNLTFALKKLNKHCLESGCNICCPIALSSYYLIIHPIILLPYRYILLSRDLSPVAISPYRHIFLSPDLSPVALGVFIPCGGGSFWTLLKNDFPTKTSTSERIKTWTKSSSNFHFFWSFLQICWKITTPSKIVAENKICVVNLVTLYINFAKILFSENKYIKRKLNSTTPQKRPFFGGGGVKIVITFYT